MEPTTVMQAILTAIGQMLTSVATWFTSLITSVSGVFYDSTNGFTFIGTLLLVAFGLGCFWVVVKFISRLVRRG